MTIREDLSSAETALSAKIKFLLNGEAVESDPRGRSLMGVLREDFGCISLKNGCEPQASCGCCTLLLDGKPRLSCTMKPSMAAGKTVVTLEGLPAEQRQQIGSSFAN